jgi:hypothetical protein
VQLVGSLDSVGVEERGGTSIVQNGESNDTNQTWGENETKIKGRLKLNNEHTLVNTFAAMVSIKIIDVNKRSGLCTIRLDWYGMYSCI